MQALSCSFYIDSLERLNAARRRSQSVSRCRRCLQVSAVAPLRARCGSALRICVPSAACATCMLRVHFSIRRSEAPKAIAERPAAEQGGAEHSSTPDAAQGRSCLRIFLCLSQAHSRRSHWFVVRSGCFCYLCHARRPAHAAHARFLTAPDARPLAPGVRALILPRCVPPTALFHGSDLPIGVLCRRWWSRRAQCCVAVAIMPTARGLEVSKLSTALYSFGTSFNTPG